MQSQNKENCFLASKWSYPVQVLKTEGRTEAQKAVLSSNADVQCETGIDDIVLMKFLAYDDTGHLLTAIYSPLRVSLCCPLQ